MTKLQEQARFCEMQVVRHQANDGAREAWIKALNEIFAFRLAAVKPYAVFVFWWEGIAYFNVEDPNHVTEYHHSTVSIETLDRLQIHVPEHMTMEAYLERERRA